MGWKCVSLWNGGVCIPFAKRMFFFSHAVVSSRYYAKTTSVNWPPEVKDYNVRFTKILNAIKKRHDPTVTTVAQGVLEWKRSQNARSIGLDIQAWLDRFYMSRIGIRFLIGQRESPILPPLYWISLLLYIDVALNTQQSHEDYVGIICTRAVSLPPPFSPSSWHSQINPSRTYTISSKKPSRTRDSSAKNTTPCSKAPPSSSSVPKTSVSPTSQAIYPTSASNC